MTARLAAAVLWCVLTAAACEAAVAFDNFCATQDQVSPASPFTCSITLGAGTKGVAVLIAFRDNLSLPTISSVTVGSVSLSLVANTSVTSGLAHSEIWCSTTTETGAQTASVNFTGGNVWVMSIGAISATGIDTGTPCNNGANTSNTGSPISIAMTSSSGDLTATTMYGNNGSGNPTTNQTVRWNTAALFPHGGDTGPGTANPTHTWTTGGLDWNPGVMSGVNFKASSGASAAGAGVNGPVLKGLVGGGLVP